MADTKPRDFSGELAEIEEVITSRTQRAMMGGIEQEGDSAAEPQEEASIVALEKQLDNLNRQFESNQRSLAERDMRITQQIKAEVDPLRRQHDATAEQPQSTKPLNLGDIEKPVQDAFVIFASSIDDKIKTLTQKLDEAVNGRVQPKLKEFDDYLTRQRENEVKNDIAQAQKKYPDFEKFIPKMVELHTQQKNGQPLSAEVLYAAAKLLSGSRFAEQAASSERPTDAPGGTNRPKVKMNNIGEAGFMARLNARHLS